MLSIITAMLNLWDPYKIYCFPDDEYINEAIKINEFMINNKNINENSFVDYVFKILPPLDKNNDINKSLKDNLLKLEYYRFAKLLFLILNNK